MGDLTREQYAELGARILTALPINPDDGAVIVEYQADGIPLWGNPQQVVDRIEGVFFQMDLAVVTGAELDALRHAVNRVRDMHRPHDSRFARLLPDGSITPAPPKCASCRTEPYPCPTARALPPEGPA